MFMLFVAIAKIYIFLNIVCILGRYFFQRVQCERYRHGVCRELAAGSAMAGFLFNQYFLAAVYVDFALLRV